jgi:transposase
MTKPYNLDIRTQAINSLAAGKSAVEVANLLGVSKATVYHWKNQGGKRKGSKRRVKFYSKNLRDEALSAVDTGESIPSAARRLGIVENTLRKWRVKGKGQYTVKSVAKEDKTPPRVLTEPRPRHQRPETETILKIMRHLLSMVE